ncbi:hypothetical protein AAG570_011825 [Ranatra chinensis]|uniref:Uncharacterized protein n=1 Tax=Ranatra chinensis TaxID=642074 RepID=A0ABD0YJ06_9HEMI
MESTLKGSHSSRPQLIAKSPTSDKTLITGGSVSRPGVSGRVRWAIGCLGTVQLVSGLAMSVLGVLCSAYGLAMSRLGAGVSGGLVALLAGLVGLTAAFLPTAVYFTLYLALCLVSLLVNTLVLVLTLLAVVRDAQIDVHLLSPDQVSPKNFIFKEKYCVPGK